MGKFFEGTGHYYEYVRADQGVIGWQKANTDASKKNWNGVQGYLPDIFGNAENEFVSNLSGNINSWNVGLTDDVQEGHYIWSGGEKKGQRFTWNNDWNPFWNGEPNNAYHDPWGDEDYIGMYNSGYWNDWPYWTGLPGYVVEYGRVGAEYELEEVSISNGIEGSTDTIITFKFDRSIPAGYELNGVPFINLNVELTVDGKEIPDNYLVQNDGNGTIGFWGNNWTFNGSSDEFKVRITRDDERLDKQIQEIKFNVQAQDDQFVKTNNHSGTAYLLEDETEISLGNGLIQKIYLPNPFENTLNLDKRTPDYTLFDTEIDYQSKDDFYSKLSLKDSFSIRWETYISIPESGTYKFWVTNDDGVRLTVNDENGKEIGKIDSWKDQGSTSYSTELKDLKKGDVVWLQYDYYQGLGGAQAHLQWQKPGDSDFETIPADAMFLTEEIAKTGNTIDELTSGTNTKPGYEFIANSKLDDDNTYAISTQSSYDLDFSLSYGEENTYKIWDAIQVKKETFQTDEANRRVDDKTFPTDDYAIYTKNSEGVFNTFREQKDIGLNDYNWQTNDPTAGTIGVAVFSDSFGEDSESIKKCVYSIDNQQEERNW